MKRNYAKEIRRIKELHIKITQKNQIWIKFISFCQFADIIHHILEVFI